MKNNQNFPLTLAQTDIYNHQVLFPDVPFYNSVGAIKCGCIDIDKITKAHQKLISAQDAFGLRIVGYGENVQQYISNERTLNLPIIDFSASNNPELTALEWIKKEIQIPFTLADNELFKSFLVKISPVSYWKCLIAHHLILDGVSGVNVISKLAQFYNNAEHVDPQSTSWVELSHKDQQYLQSKKYQKDQDFWKDYCANVPSNTLEPHYLTAVNENKSGRHTIKLSRATFDKLELVAIDLKVGVPQIFLGILAAYISVVYNKERLSFGMPIHNRANFTQRHMIGTFANVLPLFMSIDTQKSFKDLVVNIAESYKVRQRHLKFPLGHIQDIKTGNNNLFDILFNYKISGASYAFGDVEIKNINLSHDVAKEPLSMMIMECDIDTVDIFLDYSLAYFADSEIAFLANRLEYIIHSVLKGTTTPLKNLGIIPAKQSNCPPYRNYDNWLAEQQLYFWQAQLDFTHGKGSLPFVVDDKCSKGDNNDHVGHLSFTDDEIALLIEFSHLKNTSINIMVQAAWAFWLHRYTNNNTAMFGLSSGRLADLPMNGKVVVSNILPHLIAVKGDVSASDWLKMIQNQQEQRDEYSRVLLSGSEYDEAGLNELFDSLLVFENNLDSEDGSEVMTQYKNQNVQRDCFNNSVYNITLGIDISDIKAIKYKIKNNVFDQAQLEKSLLHFQRVLLDLVSSTQKNVSQLQMLTAVEVDQQLIGFNDSASDLPKDKCIHELFELQVRENPDAIALEFEGSQLTYGELNAKANQLAYYLIEERRIIPDTLVGICVERSLDMVIGILGILKAGGAYVPLDPAYPAARLAYMLDDARLTTVLTHSALKGETPVTESQAVTLDSEAMQNKLNNYSMVNIPSNQLDLTSNHLAYVIYTSGSTGQPKGVMQSHRTLSCLLLACDFSGEISAPLKTSCFSSMSFDVSLQEIMTPLYLGGGLVIATQQSKDDLFALVDFLKHNNVERFFVTPAVLYILVEECERRNITLNSLKQIIVAGEALSLSGQLAGFLSTHKQCTLWNHYGPTETHVVTTQKVKGKGDVNVAIGHPISGSECYILNSELALLPYGVAGELFIGGACFANGYLNQPELTAEKFIANPFYDKNNPDSAEHLYKTGDLVRWLPDGNLDFLGRIDHQIKVRGFRIELGEIEQKLLTHDAVNDAVVVALSSKEGDKRLVAYITHDNAAAMTTEDKLGDEEAQALRHAFIDSLKATLGQALPDYMIPSAFVVLAQLPLTANGKVDRKGLPSPDISLQQKAYVAPSTKTEKRLCEIWQEVLGIERVGITDNFFELGGHSLLVTKLVTKVNKQFAIELALKDLFSVPSISQLAVLADDHIVINQLSSGEIDISSLTETQLERYLDVLQKGK